MAIALDERTQQAIIAALGARGFKEEKPNQWRGISPARAGAENPNFVVTRQESGWFVAVDHVTKDGYNTFQLADLIGVDVERNHVPSTKTAYRNLKEYAEAHGANEAVFIKAGWQDRPPYQSRPCISYSTATGERYRFIDGKEPRYKSYDGYESCWYRLDEAVDLARQRNKPLIICNGEATTVVAQMYGFPATSTTSGEGGKLPDHLLEQLQDRWTGPIILALDCDKAGRTGAIKIMTQLIGHELSNVDLGLTDGGDLADFCKLHGRDSYAAFYALVPPAKPVDQAAIMEAAGEDFTRNLAALLSNSSRASTIAERAQQAKDTELQLARAKLALQRVERVIVRPAVVSASDVASSALAAFERRLNGEIKGFPTGFPGIDAAGGLEPGNVYVILGATGMGKSTVATSIVAAAGDNHGILVVPTEITPETWQNRLAAAALDIPYGRIIRANVTPDEATRYAAFMRRVISSSSRVSFYDGQSPTLEALNMACLQKRDSPGGLKLVVVDSVSNLFNAGDYQAVDRVSNGLLEIARAYGVPVVATSQVSRDVGKRGVLKKMPTLSDAKGGGVIEEIAAVVLGTYRHQYYELLNSEAPHPDFPHDTAILYTLKDRDKAFKKSYLLNYVPGCRFVEAAKSHHEEKAAANGYQSRKRNIDL